MRCLATRDCLEARRLTQLIDGELSPNIATHFFLERSADSFHCQPQQ